MVYQARLANYEKWVQVSFGTLFFQPFATINQIFVNNYKVNIYFNLQ